MKHLFLLILLALGISLQGQELVILHTNDTHSQLLPDRSGQGGIARRKVLIDSVRNRHPNVLLIDAGDAVQGSLFFTLYNGEVERKLMNALGYDIRILGNHEFDNGLQSLADEWKKVNAVKISTNYDFTGTPADSLFAKSVIRVIDGKKVGFIGVNLNPVGMITAENYKGMGYRDAITSANQEAALLKKLGADKVIAITHIGYKEGNDEDDVTLAQKSQNIDLIIGGHSHTRLDKPKRVKNLTGKDVVIVQTGSKGTMLGQTIINLDNDNIESTLIPVNSRLDDRLSPEIAAIIEPYQAGVDSLKHNVIGISSADMKAGSQKLRKLLTEVVKNRGSELIGEPVDLAIMNNGGIRNGLLKGSVTEGDIIDMLPFDNKVVVVEVTKNDLLRTLDLIDQLDNCTTSARFSFKGKKRYKIATIDYLAAGNDYLTPLANSSLLKKSDETLSQTLINAIRNNQLSPIKAK